MTRLLLSLGALVVLAAGTALSGCDCGGGDGCAGIPLATPFADDPTLRVPEVFVTGEATPISVRTRLRVGGTGYVQIGSQVARLRTLAPVADTVDLVAGRRALTDSVRIAFVPGEAVEVPWRVAVDELDGVGISPLALRALVTVDSVRLADGRLVPLMRDFVPTTEACALLTGSAPDGGFCSADVVDRARSDDAPVTLRR